MYPYKNALTIIKTFEGFSEKAYPDPDTGGAPYTIGYGTTYYPDGSEVKQGAYVHRAEGSGVCPKRN